jgi:hypothetical protein
VIILTLSSPTGGRARPTHDQKDCQLFDSKFLRNNYCVQCKTGGSLVECDHCNLAYPFTFDG